MVAFGAFALLSPKTLGKAFDGVGCYSASVFFYEKDYKKSGDIESLNRLVLKLDENKDSARAEKYYAEIISHKDFESLCQRQNTNGKLTAKEYYYGNYALTLALNCKFDKALDLGKEFVKDGYTAYNPIRVLVYEFISAQKTEEIAKTITVLEDLSKEMSEGYITSDIAYLQSLVNG